jgi:hypothetical protein
MDFFFATEAKNTANSYKREKQREFYMEGDITYNMKKTGTQDELKLT